MGIDIWDAFTYRFTMIFGELFKWIGESWWIYRWTLFFVKQKAKHILLSFQAKPTCFFPKFGDSAKNSSDLAWPPHSQTCPSIESMSVGDTSEPTIDFQETC